MKNARTNAKKQGGQVFYSGNVTKHHIKSNGKDERILVITHLFISYYTKKGENSNTNYWVDLKSITVQKKDKNTLIKLEFDQNEFMNFEYPTKLKIDTILLETVKYMTTGQNIRIEGIDAPLNFIISPRSIFNIFLSQAYLNNNNLPKPLKSSIRMICRLHSKVVGFIPEMINQYFPFLLKAIVNTNYIESFRIPELPNTDVYGCLSEFLKSNKYEFSSIIHLQISKQDMKKFSTFCDSFSKGKSPNNRISALTFSNTEFDQESIKALSESIINSKWNGGFEVNSIKFDNAVKDDVNFVDSFFPNSASIQSTNSPLKLFSLNRMRIADISQLISLLKGIRVLSLSYMGLEISSVFQAISNSGLDDLSLLNVSGNFLNESNSNVKKLPPTLQRLDMNEVDFFVKSANSEKSNAMTEFFLSVLKRKWNSYFYLSLSHIFCHNNNEGPFPPEKALEFLFTQLKKAKNSSCKILKGLSFSCNFVNDDFFSFLKKCQNLRMLYIDFCLASDSPCLSSFCDALSNSLPKLNVLSVKGDIRQNRVLGEFFPTFCKTLKKCKSLSTLIVSDNLIGLKGLQAMSKLFDPAIEEDNDNDEKGESEGGSEGESESSEKKTKKQNNNNKSGKNFIYDSISSISFDNCNAPSLMPILGVVAKATLLKRPILIDFPTQEVWRLKQENIAEKVQIRELRERLEFVYTKNQNGKDLDRPSKVKQDVDLKPITQYWNKPFTEYKIPTNDFFPEYMSPDVNLEVFSPEKAQISDEENENENENENETETDESEKKSKQKDEDDSENDSGIVKKKSNKKKEESSNDENDSESDNKKKKKRKKTDDDESSDNESIKKKNKRSSKKKSESDDDDDEDDDEPVIKKKRGQKKKSKLESESDDEEESNGLKKRKKIRGIRNKNSIESDSESENNGFLKSGKKKKRGKSLRESDSDEENESDDDDDSNQRKKSKMKRKSSKKIFSESDSDDNDNPVKYKNSTKNKRSSRKSEANSDSDFDDSDLDLMKSRKRNKKVAKMDDSSDNNDDENESFPLTIDSKKEKKLISNLKKKFSINHLQEEITNN